MLLLSNTLFWVNQPLLLLLKAACFVEQQQIPILQVFALNRTGFEDTIYRTRGEYANHYTTNAVLDIHVMHFL